MEYENVYKLRRKSDGMFYSQKDGWTKSGKAFSSPLKLLTFLASSKIDNPENIEVATFDLTPKCAINLADWKDYAENHKKRFKKSIINQGKFLFAVINSNLQGTARPDTVLQNFDGWFSIEEIDNKFSLRRGNIEDIIANYTRIDRINGAPEEVRVFKMNEYKNKITITPRPIY